MNSILQKQVVQQKTGFDQRENKISEINNYLKYKIKREKEPSHDKASKLMRLNLATMHAAARNLSSSVERVSPLKSKCCLRKVNAYLGDSRINNLP